MANCRYPRGSLGVPLLAPNAGREWALRLGISCGARPSGSLGADPCGPSLIRASWFRRRRSQASLHMFLRRDAAFFVFISTRPNDTALDPVVPPQNVRNSSDTGSNIDIQRRSVRIPNETGRDYWVHGHIVRASSQALRVDSCRVSLPGALLVPTTPVTGR